jgi:hypothetical protein
LVPKISKYKVLALAATTSTPWRLICGILIDNSWKLDPPSTDLKTTTHDAPHGPPNPAKKSVPSGATAIPLLSERKLAKADLNHVPDPHVLPPSVDLSKTNPKS